MEHIWLRKPLRRFYITTIWLLEKIKVRTTQTIISCLVTTETCESVEKALETSSWQCIDSQDSIHLGEIQPTNLPTDIWTSIMIDLKVI